MKITFLDVDSRPWDFQAEECSLRCAVDRFNHRRYEKTSQSAAAATARAAAAAAAAGGNGQELGTMNREIIVSCLAFCVFIKSYINLMHEKYFGGNFAKFCIICRNQMILSLSIIASHQY